MALTVNLGQPGEDFEVVQRQGAAARARSTATWSTRARSSPRDYVLPGDQGERALRRRLPAVHRARPAADREAGGGEGARDGLRHDRPRLHRQGQRPGADRGHRAGARARAEDHRAGARLADGPRGGDRLRARARHPGEGRHRGAALLDRRQPLGPLVRGRPDRGPRRAAARRRLRARHRARGRAGRAAGRGGRVRARRARWRSTASGSASWSCSSAPARSAPATASGSSTTSRTGSSGSRCATSTRCPAAAIILPAHKELEKLVGTIHQNNFKPQLDDQWAFLVYAGLWHEPLLGDLNAYMDVRERAGDGRDHDAALQGLAPGRWRASRRTRSTTRRWPASASRAASSRSRRARASSSSGACSRGWLTRSGTGKRRKSMNSSGYTVLGWIVWQVGLRVAKRKMAQNRVKLGAAAAVALVLVGGVLAARATAATTSSGPDTRRQCLVAANAELLCRAARQEVLDAWRGPRRVGRSGSGQLERPGRSSAAAHCTRIQRSQLDRTGGNDDGATAPTPVRGALWPPARRPRASEAEAWPDREHLVSRRDLGDLAATRPDQRAMLRRPDGVRRTHLRPWSTGRWARLSCFPSWPARGDSSAAGRYIRVPLPFRRSMRRHHAEQPGLLPRDLPRPFAAARTFRHSSDLRRVTLAHAPRGCAHDRVRRRPAFATVRARLREWRAAGRDRCRPPEWRRRLPPRLRELLRMRALRPPRIGGGGRDRATRRA